MTPTESYEFSPAAIRDLRKLDISVRTRIFDALDRFVANPRDADIRKLSGRDDQWRLRVGTLRIIFQRVPDSALITVTRVAHRREAYRR